MKQCVPYIHVHSSYTYSYTCTLPFAILRFLQVKTLPPYPEPEVRVPAGHVWLEGDEPFYSIDSNTWGPVRLVFRIGSSESKLTPTTKKVAIALLDAKIDLVLWPPSRFGWIEPRVPRPVTHALSATDVAWKRELGDMAGRGVSA